MLLDCKIIITPTNRKTDVLAESSEIVRHRFATRFILEPVLCLFLFHHTAMSRLGRHHGCHRRRPNVELHRMILQANHTWLTVKFRTSEYSFTALTLLGVGDMKSIRPLKISPKESQKVFFERMWGPDLTGVDLRKNIGTLMTIHGSQVQLCFHVSNLGKLLDTCSSVTVQHNLVLAKMQ